MRNSPKFVNEINDKQLSFGNLEKYKKMTNNSSSSDRFMSDRHKQVIAEDELNHIKNYLRNKFRKFFMKAIGKINLSLNEFVELTLSEENNRIFNNIMRDLRKELEKRGHDLEKEKINIPFTFERMVSFQSYRSNRSDLFLNFLSTENWQDKVTESLKLFEMKTDLLMDERQLVRGRSLNEEDMRELMISFESLDGSQKQLVKLNNSYISKSDRSQPNRPWNKKRLSPVNELYPDDKKEEEEIQIDYREEIHYMKKLENEIFFNDKYSEEVDQIKRKRITLGYSSTFSTKKIEELVYHIEKDKKNKNRFIPKHNLTTGNETLNSKNSDCSIKLVTGNTQPAENFADKKLEDDQQSNIFVEDYNSKDFEGDDQSKNSGENSFGTKKYEKELEDDQSIRSGKKSEDSFESDIEKEEEQNKLFPQTFVQEPVEQITDSKVKGTESVKQIFLPSNRLCQLLGSERSQMSHSVSSQTLRQRIRERRESTQMLSPDISRKHLPSEYVTSAFKFEKLNKTVSEKSDPEEPIFTKGLDYKIKYDYLLQLKNQFGIDCTNRDDQLNHMTKEQQEISPQLGYRGTSNPKVFETEVDIKKMLGALGGGLLSLLTKKPEEKPKVKAEIKSPNTFGKNLSKKARMAYYDPSNVLKSYLKQNSRNNIFGIGDEDELETMPDDKEFLKTKKCEKINNGIKKIISDTQARNEKLVNDFREEDVQFGGYSMDENLYKEDLSVEFKPRKKYLRRGQSQSMNTKLIDSSKSLIKTYFESKKHRKVKDYSKASLSLNKRKKCVNDLPGTKLVYKEKRDKNDLNNYIKTEEVVILDQNHITSTKKNLKSKYEMKGGECYQKKMPESICNQFKNDSQHLLKHKLSFLNEYDGCSINNLKEKFSLSQLYQNDYLDLTKLTDKVMNFKDDRTCASHNNRSSVINKRGDILESGNFNTKSGYKVYSSNISDIHQETAKDKVLEDLDDGFFFTSVKPSENPSLVIEKKVPSRGVFNKSIDLQINTSGILPNLELDETYRKPKAYQLQNSLNNKPYKLSNPSTQKQHYLIKKELSSKQTLTPVAQINDAQQKITQIRTANCSPNKKIHFTTVRKAENAYQPETKISKSVDKIKRHNTIERGSTPSISDAGTQGVENQNKLDNIANMTVRHKNEFKIKPKPESLPQDACNNLYIKGDDALLMSHIQNNFNKITAINVVDGKGIESGVVNPDFFKDLDSKEEQILNRRDTNFRDSGAKNFLINKVVHENSVAKTNLKTYSGMDRERSLNQINNSGRINRHDRKKSQPTFSLKENKLKSQKDIFEESATHFRENKNYIVEIPSDIGLTPPNEANIQFQSNSINNKTSKDETKCISKSGNVTLDNSNKKDGWNKLDLMFNKKAAKNCDSEDTKMQNKSSLYKEELSNSKLISSMNTKKEILKKKYVKHGKNKWVSKKEEPEPLQQNEQYYFNAAYSRVPEKNDDDERKLSFVKSKFKSTHTRDDISNENSNNKSNGLSDWKNGRKSIDFAIKQEITYNPDSNTSRNNDQTKYNTKSRFEPKLHCTGVSLEHNT